LEKWVFRSLLQKILKSYTGQSRCLDMLLIDSNKLPLKGLVPDHVLGKVFLHKSQAFISIKFVMLRLASASAGFWAG